MVIDASGVALELLAVVQGFNVALDRFVGDFAIGLAQPVAVRVHTLLHRVKHRLEMSTAPGAVHYRLTPGMRPIIRQRDLTKRKSPA